MNPTKNKVKKILLIGNSKLVIFGFRGELVERLVKDGYEVYVSFPNGPFGDGEAISKEYGYKFIEIAMNRRGKNPLEELFLLHRYFRLINTVKPDVVLAFTVKCDIYGGIVCRLLNIPFMPNITGLGKGLDEGGLTEKITCLLYKLAVSKAQCVFFQNERDMRYFIDNKIKFKTGQQLPGSGVNLIKFHPLPYPADGKIIFTYIARVMKAKGIEQFLYAAKALKKENYNVEFHICGYCEEDYKNIIAEAEANDIVVYHGLVEDVIEYERISHCIVLPSFHPEGISNVLLEAAACARPIITTDRPGCREAVDNGITGFLVKERDGHDLAEKMRMFLSLSHEKRELMGINGRHKIEKEFDRQSVVNSYVSQIDLTGK